MRFSCLGLIAALLLVPVCATAAEPKRAAGTETIPATGFLVLSVNVAQLWDAEQLAGLRKGLQDGKNPFVKDLKGEVGLDLADIERVTVTMPTFPFEGGNRSLPILYVTARKSLEVPKLMKGIDAVTVAEFRKEKPNFPEELDGKNVYVVEGKKMVVVIDDRTFAILQSSGGPEETAKLLGDLKTGKPAQEGPLADALALAPEHTLVIGVDFAPVRKALEAVGEVPAEYKPLASMVQAERGLLTFDFGAKVSAAAQLAPVQPPWRSKQTDRWMSRSSASSKTSRTAHAAFRTSLRARSSRWTSSFCRAKISTRKWASISTPRW